MRAAVLNRGEMLVRADLPEPKPAQNQVLVQVKACGICGSDLHFAQHGQKMLDLTSEMGGGGLTAPLLDLDRDVFMGHEFAAEVLEVGPDTDSPLGPGSIVTSIPVLFGPSGIEPIVYSNTTLGGYAERMLLSSFMLLEVPNGLPAEQAALTEPMAVGLHAVNKSNIQKGETAVVLGCGPVGLSVIAALRLRGVEHVIATDFSPARRSLALGLGAHQAVDPREETAWAALSRSGRGGAPVIFEAIGVPGILNEILRSAPNASRLVVVGVCMETDTINPFFGISKELNVQFALAYDPTEFAASLRAIAEGEIDVAPLVTAQVGLDRVGWAFEALGDPEQHCKIIVTP
jgi:threonine dehydrogenase-like Zn-dependent dehydrogenase